MTRPHIDVVAVAASAGGIRALGQLLETLPPNLRATVVIVQHLNRRHPSLLADILNRRTYLPVRQAKEGDRLAPGTVLIAPPNRQRGSILH